MGECIPVQGAKDLGSSHISAKDLPWNLANATRTHPAWPPGLHWYHERLAHVKLQALCRPLLLHPPAGCVLPPTFPHLLPRRRLKTYQTLTPLEDTRFSNRLWTEQRPAREPYI